MNEAKEFLKTLSQNPEAVEMIKAAGEPAGIEEAAALYADVAAKTGINVSRESILAILDAKEKIQKEKTARAENAVKEALDERELERVAGGVVYNNCEAEATSTDWCWFSDACDLAWNWYSADDIYIPTDENGKPIKKTYVYVEDDPDLGKPSEECFPTYNEFKWNYGE